MQNTVNYLKDNGLSLDNIHECFRLYDNLALIKSFWLQQAIIEKYTGEKRIKGNSATEALIKYKTLWKLTKKTT